MKKLFKKKWFIVLLIVALLALIAGSAYFFFFRKKDNAMQDQEFVYVRTVTLSYGSLSETVVASGTIESQNTSTITSSVNNATVSKINYAVGDYVNEGDVIIELDTTNLNKQIDKASENVESKEKQLQSAYDDAYDNYDDIEDKCDTARCARNNSRAAYEEALGKCSDYQDKYDSDEAALNEYITQKLSEGANIDDIKTNKDGLYPEYEELNSSLMTSSSNLQEIKSITNLDELYKIYQSDQSTYEQYKSQLSQAEEKLESAQETLEDGVDTDTLDELYDTVDDYKIKAKSSGQITSISAVVGSSTNGTLATIQDTSKLKISVSIDEYDILKLELGMKATIETDASDEIYEGVVSQISPTASGNFGSTGFEVEVNITSTNVENLKIGMSAEVTIILSSTDESFSVPVDAIETKDNGKKIVYVENEDGDFVEVEVEVGDSNGYYIQIYSDELKAGDKVRASADESEAEVSVSEDSAFPDMGGMSGNFSMPDGGGSSGGGRGGSGNMPSGGGGMPGGF